MRIIAGTLGGRQFKTPKGHRTHPMSDKVRGGLFNALGDITGLSVLDAFAGSGALSYEASSRGAGGVVAVELDHRAQQVIAENLASLGIHNVKLVSGNVSGWSNKNPSTMFDLVLADPPYDRLQEDTLEKIVRHLKPAGTMVVSWPGGYELPRMPHLTLISNKDYGDAQLVFYQHIR